MPVFLTKFPEEEIAVLDGSLSFLLGGVFFKICRLKSI